MENKFNDAEFLNKVSNMKYESGGEENYDALLEKAIESQNDDNYRKAAEAVLAGELTYLNCYYVRGVGWVCD
jgi:hypothetical protein